VGKPPQEDVWMGKATERLFLPLMKLFMGEIVDVNMPPEGVFHNLVVVSVRKKYPGHAQKIMYGLWGLGLMMLTKGFIIVDGDVNVQNVAEVAARVLETVDWRRDVTVVDGAVDQLDHSAIFDSYGGKIGLDATRKPERPPFAAPAPLPVEQITALAGKKWAETHQTIIVAVDKGHHQPKAIMRALWEIAPDYNVIVVDDFVDVQNLSDVAWRALGNVDWRRDIEIKGGPVNPYDTNNDQPRGQLGIDATSKTAADGHPRGWPQEVAMSPEIVALVDKKWKDYGIK
ncbi:MAG: UbiD family decarboxylase, partial [Anaerolineae bacterium]|nr:UbiD family decarboxylase [Anaerolineae bacterium]